MFKFEPDHGKQRVLVDGGDSYIGVPLVHALRAAGFAPYPISSWDDITEEVLKSFAAVVYLAGFPQKRTVSETTGFVATASSHISKLAKVGIPVVYVSTTSIYADCPIVDNETPSRPTDIDAIARHAVELHIRNTHDQYVILRFPEVVGAIQYDRAWHGDWTSPINRLVGGVEPDASLPPSVNILHVSDAANALVAGVKAAINAENYTSSVVGERVNIDRLVDDAGRFVKVPFYTIADPSHPRILPSARFFHYRPRPIDIGTLAASMRDYGLFLQARSGRMGALKH